MKKIIPERPTPEPDRGSWLSRRLGFDAGGRGLAASGLSVVVAGALLTGIVPGIGLNGAQPVTQEPALPTLPIEPANNDDPIRPSDGLTHLIVTPNTERIQHEATPIETSPPTEPSGSGGTATSNGAAASDDDRDLSELDALRHAPKGSSLVVTPTGIAVRFPDGTVVALDDVLATESTPAAGTDAPVTDDDTSPRQRQIDALDALPVDATVADQLAGLPGVERVAAIGDGSYSVSLEDPAALDGLDVTIVEESYFASFSEPYERLEWYLENDGATMRQYTAKVSIDADIDGTVAIQHATGAGVVAAVIDTGVDFSHPDLAPNKWTNPGEVCGNGIDDDANGYVDDCHGFDFVYRDGTGYNPGASEHGTHVAGTIAAARNGIGVAGVAPDASIMDLNVSNTDGSLAGGSIAEAVRYAVDNGADIINLSLGTKPGGAPSAVIGSAIDYAADRGVLVVVAAGNDNANLDVASVWPASYDKPNMMTVGATSPDDSKASFSNYGGAVDIFAPGDIIASTVPINGAANPYKFMSGTSMATPVVVGAAALLLADDPSMTPQQVIAQLRSTSDIDPALARFAADGRRINAGEALGGALPDGSPVTELAVTMTGLTNLTTAEPLASSLRFAVPDDTFDEDYHWEMVLLADESSGIYALIDFPVVLNDNDITTGAAGAIGLGVTGTSEVAITAALPAGDYGLIFEAVPDIDPSVRLGNPFVVTFTVGDNAGETAPGPDSPEPAPPGTPPPGTPASPGSPTSPGTDPDTGGGGGTTSPTPANPPTPGSEGGSAPGSGGQTSTPTTGGDGSADGGTSDGGAGAGGTDDAGSGNGGGNSTNPGSAPVAPPSKTTPGSQPTVPSPEPVEDAGYAVRTVSPYVGPLGEQTQVTIVGTFPQPVHVFFGSVEASSLSQTATRIVALSPPGSQAGPIDIRLVRNGATVLSVGNGYTYLATDDDVPTSPPGGNGTGGGSPATDAPGSDAPNTGSPAPDTPGNPGSGNPGSDNPGSDNPGSDNPDTGNPGSGTPDGGSSDEGNQHPQQRRRQSRQSVGTQRVDLGDGRTGAPLEGGDPLTMSTPCRSNTCRAGSG